MVYRWGREHCAVAKDFMKDPQYLVYKSSFSGKIQRRIWREVHPFFSLLVLGESFLSGFEKQYTTNFLDRANVNNTPTSGQGFLFLHFISFDLKKKYFLR